MTKVLAAVLVLGSVASVAVAEEPWSGVWQAEQDPGRMVRFHDGRHFSVSDGRLTWVAQIVAVSPGRLTVCSWGRPSVLLVTVDGDRLELGFEGQAGTGTFRRLAEVPPLFEPAPLPLGTAKVNRARLKELQAELVRRGAEDQRVRTEEVEPEEERRVDADNTAYLRQLVSEVGWVDRKRFGTEASEAAFLVVQHSGDLELMQAALPRLEAEDGQSYALLFDRLQVALARPQRFGTQLGATADGGVGVIPVEDRERVDERRASVGLPPLEEYVKLFGLESVTYLVCP